MDTVAEHKPKHRGWRSGCLVLVLLGLGLMVWAFREIGEPGRRAREVFATIHPGMNALKLEPLLTGRHYCVYQVQRADGWEIVTREDFQKLITPPNAGAPLKLRLMLTFMGMSPGRTSFFVEVGGDGRVLKAENPYNWD